MVMIMGKFGIKSLLKKHNALEDFKAGKMKCFHCGDIISFNNLGVFTTNAKGLVFCCANPGCALNIDIDN